MNTIKKLIPRHGSTTTMSQSPHNTIVLLEGEMFIEVDTENSLYRIKIGDGSTQYSSLDYAFSIDPSDLPFDNTGTDLTATNIQDAIEELAQSAGGLYYGTCNTAADTATKAVTISQSQNFALEVGATIIVKFDYTNTASTPQLNVNSTGVKSIYYDNAVYTGNDPIVAGAANTCLMYIYDGTNWVWLSHGSDKDTTYAAVTSNEIVAGSDTTVKAVRADYLKTGINDLIDDKTWTGTQAEYDLINNPDPTINYYIVPASPNPEPSEE